MNKIQKTFITVTALAAIMATTGTARAGLIAEDSFTALNGGTGWDGNWSAGPFTVQSGSLDNGSSLETSGGKFETTASGTLAGRKISSAITSGVVYMSALVNVNNSLGGGDRFAIGAGELEPWLAPKTSTVRGIGQPDYNGSQWQPISGGVISGVGSDVGAISNNTSYLVVLKFDLDNDTMSGWLNPSSLGGAEDASPVFTGQAVAANNIDGVYINRQDSPNVVRVDELRLGTTWADVTPVPEPSSIALLGIAGLLAVVIGRRRRA